MTGPVNSEAGGATLQGELWSARAADWADQEELQAPIYEAILDDLGVTAGTRVLDVACGSGVAVRAAIARGATAAGIDVAPALVEIARRRAPAADLHVCAMEQLPFADDAFDVVTGFNAFQFADDIVVALREARRVTRTGGSVADPGLGPTRAHGDRRPRPRLRAAPALPAAVGARRPQPVRAGRARGARVGRGPRTARRPRHLVPVRLRRCGDARAASLGAGLALLATRIAGEDVVRQGILDAMAPFRKADGSYHTENEWHYLIATA